MGKKEILIAIWVTVTFFICISSVSNATSIYPASTSKSGYPTAISKLRVASLNADETKLTLRWNPAPTSEQVDKYAVYGFYMDPYFDEREPGILLGITRANTLSVTLTTKHSMTVSLPFQILQGKGSWSYFWVIAHNRFGWGQNDRMTPNPGDKYPVEMQTGFINYLYMEFRCTSKGRIDGVCFPPSARL